MQSHSECLRPIFCTLLLCTSLMMTDCGLTTDGPGAVFVDPGMYANSSYRCDDLSLAGILLSGTKTKSSYKANQSAAEA